MFDVTQANKDGISNDAIVEFLAKKHNFNLEAAYKDGVSKQEIIGFLSGRTEPEKPPAVPEKTTAELAAGMIDAPVEPPAEGEPPGNLLEFTGKALALPGKLARSYVASPVLEAIGMATPDQAAAIKKSGSFEPVLHQLEGESPSPGIPLSKEAAELAGKEEGELQPTRIVSRGAILDTITDPLMYAGSGLASKASGIAKRVLNLRRYPAITDVARDAARAAKAVEIPPGRSGSPEVQTWDEAHKVTQPGGGTTPEASGPTKPVSQVMQAIEEEETTKSILGKIGREGESPLGASGASSAGPVKLSGEDYSLIQDAITPKNPLRSKSDISKIRPPEEVLPQDAIGVGRMYEEGDRAMGAGEPLLTKVVKWLRAKQESAYPIIKHATIDISGNVKTGLQTLSKENVPIWGGKIGEQAVMHQELVAGASMRGAEMSTEANKIIYGGIQSADEPILARIIQSRRTVSIDAGKGAGAVEHPRGLGGDAHAKYLESLSKELGAEKMAELNGRADAYFQAMKDQLTMLRNEGLLTEEAFRKLSSYEYSPRIFMQHLDPPQVGGNISRKINVSESGFPALDEGSKGLLWNNPKDLLHTTIQRTQNRIAKNRANRDLLEMAEAPKVAGLPAFQGPIVRTMKPGAKIPEGFEKIGAYRDGVRIEFLMDGKYAAEWVKTDPMIAPALAKILGYTTGAKLLKAVATGYNPAFALANIPRDLGLYWMNTKAWSSFLPKALGQMGKDLVTVSRDAITKSGRYKQYINEGGGMELLTYQGRFGGSGEKNLLSRALGYIGETSEILTRLALRERAIINGASPEKATWMARRALDFAQGGSMTKAVDTCIPYLNAGVQATRTLVRAAVVDPKRFAWQASQLMAGASGLYYANGTINPKGYDQVSDREKEANWIIMMPPSMDYRDDKGQNRSVYFKVAKDQAQRVFTTGMEMILDRFHKGKVPTDQALAAVKDFIPTPASGQMLPPFLSAWFTYVFNKDFYRNQDVWKGPSGIEPKEEYTKDTPDLWRGVGEQTGLSPERARGAVQRVVPFGNPFVGLVGKLAQLATGNEVGDEISKKVGIQLLTEIPAVRRIFASTSPYESVYKETQDVKEKYKTENFKQTRKIDELSESFYRLKTSGKPAAELAFKRIERYVESQPEVDQDRLIERFEAGKTFWNIPNRPFWLIVRGAGDPEAKAELIYNRWISLPKAEGDALLAQANSLPGILSDRVEEKFNHLKSLRGKKKK